ncbi:MAG: hypothetical protein ACT4OY_06160 [Alphaproteobacteria bacterium]
MALETVILKNGAEEAKPLVAVTMMSLEGLMQQNPIAFYELTMKARDSKHQFFGNAGQVLEKFNLVSANGSMHDSIRNIVLSAVEGDGLDMTLGNPVKAQGGSGTAPQPGGM